MEPRGRPLEPDASLAPRAASSLLPAWGRGLGSSTNPRGRSGARGRVTCRLLPSRDCSKVQERRGAVCERIATTSQETQQVRGAIQQLRATAEREKQKSQVSRPRPQGRRGPRADAAPRALPARRAPASPSSLTAPSGASCFAARAGVPECAVRRNERPQ